MTNSLKGGLQDLKNLQKQYINIQKKRAKAKAAVSPSQSPSTPAKFRLSEEDVRAFRASLKGVTKLKDSNRRDRHAVPLSHPEYYQKKREQAEGAPWFDKTALQPKAATAASQPAQAQQQFEAGTYVRDLHAADVLSKLRNGQWMIEATVDLHGYTQNEAADRFDRFMHTCIEHDVRCVNIIHGQGYGSKNQTPVLKNVIQSWLKQIPAVAAFIPAPEHSGGAGATLVLLSKTESAI
ncbi:Smr/MutS family protein [Brackiella oedipodis]|uniref:Smr/MutS family protein n=1 Tax=Brackiella oedipodis TaxID=124225 RepID=UPI00048E5222|nr:Smr/MutS family protein [Brackiella oedipodis]